MDDARNIVALSARLGIRSMVEDRRRQGIDPPETIWKQWKSLSRVRRDEIMNQFEVSEWLLSHYDHYYEDGPSQWRRAGAVDKARNIVRLCEGLPVRSLVEIGAGEGSILQKLSDVSFAPELYALEISASGVAAIENREIRGLKECLRFDGREIPYDDNRFDLAVLSHVLEHVEHPRALLYEAMRVARYVFVEVPLEDTARLPRDFVQDDVGHINFYSPRTIRRLLQSCGLQVLRQETTNPSRETYVLRMGRRGIPVYYLKEYLLRLFPRVATRVFTYHSSLLCESP